MLLNLCVKVAFPCLEVSTSLESAVEKAFRWSPLAALQTRSACLADSHQHVVRVKYTKSYAL